MFRPVWLQHFTSQRLSTSPPKVLPKVPGAIRALPSLPGPGSLPRAPDPASCSTSPCSPLWEGSSAPKERKTVSHGRRGKDVEKATDKMEVKKAHFILTWRTKGRPGGKTETLLGTELMRNGHTKGTPPIIAVGFTFCTTSSSVFTLGWSWANISFSWFRWLLPCEEKGGVKLWSVGKRWRHNIVPPEFISSLGLLPKPDSPEQVLTSGSQALSCWCNVMAGLVSAPLALQNTLTVWRKGLADRAETWYT